MYKFRVSLLMLVANVYMLRVHYRVLDTMVGQKRKPRNKEKQEMGKNSFKINAKGHKD